MESLCRFPTATQNCRGRESRQNNVASTSPHKCMTAGNKSKKRKLREAKSLRHTLLYKQLRGKQKQRESTRNTALPPVQRPKMAGRLTNNTILLLLYGRTQTTTWRVGIVARLLLVRTAGPKTGHVGAIGQKSCSTTLRRSRGPKMA